MPVGRLAEKMATIDQSEFANFFFCGLTSLIGPTTPTVFVDYFLYLWALSPFCVAATYDNTACLWFCWLWLSSSIPTVPFTQEFHHFLRLTWGCSCMKYGVVLTYDLSVRKWAVAGIIVLILLNTVLWEQSTTFTPTLFYHLIAIFSMRSETGPILMFRFWTISHQAICHYNLYYSSIYHLLFLGSVPQEWYNHSFGSLSFSCCHIYQAWPFRKLSRPELSIPSSLVKQDRSRIISDAQATDFSVAFLASKAEEWRPHLLVADGS